jgi:hypothetical protein
MFESDQHEFDEGYEELGHLAPPPPIAKQPASQAPVKEAVVDAAVADPVASLKPIVAPSMKAETTAAPVAVAEPIEEEEEENEQDDLDELDAPSQDLQDYLDPAEQEPAPVAPKKKPNLLLLAGSALLVVFAIFFVYTATRPKENAAAPGDMGPGIVAVSGLRGHLDARWEGSTKTGRLVYQLRIEPMEDRWQAGFSNTILKAPLPIYVNARLLDAGGFALCGKQIEFPFNPQNGYAPAVTVPLVDGNGKKLSAAERQAALQAARQSALAQMQAAEAQRLQGKDLFQNQLTKEGEVTAVNVQGTLPCSPDQFKQASYWDFNTNFPTLDEQAALLNGTPMEQAREAASGKRPSRKTTYRPQEGFVIQGDDRVTEYDAANGLLWARGRTFQIDRHTGQTTAMAWANNNTLIHYRCDSEANCALTAAGGTAVLHARLSN